MPCDCSNCRFIIGDPFDRQIIAQALSEKIPVVTPDEKFRLYSGLKIIW